MCQKNLRWKLGLLGKIGAFKKNDSAQGATGVKQVFCKNQCAGGTLRKFGHFGKKMGLLGKRVCERDTLVKIGLLK